MADTVLSIKKGSVVLVDDKQFELARRVLKPVEIETEAEVKPVEKKTKKSK